MLIAAISNYFSTFTGVHWPQWLLKADLCQVKQNMYLFLNIHWCSLTSMAFLKLTSARSNFFSSMASMALLKYILGSLGSPCSSFFNLASHRCTRHVYLKELALSKQQTHTSHVDLKELALWKQHTHTISHADLKELALSKHLLHQTCWLKGTGTLKTCSVWCHTHIAMLI